MNRSPPDETERTSFEAGASQPFLVLYVRIDRHHGRAEPGRPRSGHQPPARPAETFRTVDTERARQIRLTQRDRDHPLVGRGDLERSFQPQRRFDQRGNPCCRHLLEYGQNIVRALDLRQPQPDSRNSCQRGQVVRDPRRTRRVHPDLNRRTASERGDPSDRPAARLRLVVNRYRVLEVEHDEIGAGGNRLRIPFRPVRRYIESGQHLDNPSFTKRGQLFGRDADLSQYRVSVRTMGATCPADPTGRLGQPEQHVLHLYRTPSSSSSTSTIVFGAATAGPS